MICLYFKIINIKLIILYINLNFNLKKTTKSIIIEKHFTL